MKIQTSTIKTRYVLSYKKPDSCNQEFILTFYGFYSSSKKKKVVGLSSSDLAQVFEDVLQVESISFLESLPRKKNEIYDGFISQALIYEDEFRFVFEKSKKDYTRSEELVLLCSIFIDVVSCFDHFRHKVLQDFVSVESDISSIVE